MRVVGSGGDGVASAPPPGRALLLLSEHQQPEEQTVNLWPGLHPATGRRLLSCLYVCDGASISFM